MSDAPATPGARLKAAREQRGLSAQKAADELHLESWVIEALEAGDYERIGPTVYGKGYLKRYSVLLGLPVEEMLAAFGSHPPSADAPVTPVGAAPREASTMRTVSTAQMAAATAFMLLAVALAWWKPWEQHTAAPLANIADAPASAPRAAEIPPEPPTPAPVPVTAPPAVAKGLPARGAVPAPAPTAKAPVVPAVPALAASKPPGAASAAAPALAMTAKPQGPGADAGAGGGAVVDPSQLPGAGHARLRLSFTSDSWVDVRDALGNRAFAGTGSANTVKSIAGQAPMHVYLRFASGVQLEINGRVVAIGPQYFAGDVARFEAGADGVLRRESRRDATAANTRPPG